MILLLAYGVRGQDLRRYEFSHRQMGTLFRLICYATGDSLAEQAARAAFARIDELNERLSDYRPDSELTLLTHVDTPGTVIPVSEDLWNILVLSQELAVNSGGAFDLTIGPLSKLWRRAFRRQEFPDREHLAAARALVDYRQLTLLPDQQAVEINRLGMQLDAGGIAKGYAVDQAMQVLHQYGIRQALVDGGGDLLTGDAPPGSEGWRIQAPARTVSGEEGDTILWLTNAAVATSGDTYRFLEWEGKRYAHLIDPRSGLGVTFQAQVSVGCPSAALADGLASAISILGPQKSWRPLLRHYPACWVQMLFPDRKGDIQLKVFKQRLKRKEK